MNAELSTFRVGLTERHGMAKEYSQFPPFGVVYSFLNPITSSSRILRSPIKGYFSHYESEQHDLIEAILSPIFTKNSWVYSLANFQEAMAFNLCGCPLPRAFRLAYMKHLILKDNFKKLIFWSEAGKSTIRTYGGVSDERILNKVAVVYPAIRKVSENLINYSNKDVNIFFSGDFFRKGGVNVIDAFERAKNIYPGIQLTLCCDEKSDFNTSNTELRNEYLKKIHNIGGITNRGRIPRDELINTILPQTDIYLLPTYAEAFGYAILEAMAYGIPVISTNLFAIPEMIQHNTTGFLIDVSEYDCEQLFKGYFVNDIPDDFNNYVTEELYKYLCLLIDSAELREKFGNAGLETARSKFSFEERNLKMISIYREALR
jgi:glycosyltransferase involved in cell wall biosynthesis